MLIKNLVFLIIKSQEPIKVAAIFGIFLEGQKLLINREFQKKDKDPTRIDLSARLYRLPIKYQPKKTIL